MSAGVLFIVAVEMNRIDENTGVRTIHVLHHFASLDNRRNTAPRHRLNVERQTEGMRDFAEFCKVIFQTVNVVVVPGTEYLRSSEPRPRFKERLPVDGTHIRLQTENFDIQYLDARRLEIGFDFPNHRRITDHVVLRLRRRFRYQTDAGVTVVCLRRAPHLFCRIQIQHRECCQTDRARPFREVDDDS